MVGDRRGVVWGTRRLDAARFQTSDRLLQLCACEFYL